MFAQFPRVVDLEAQLLSDRQLHAFREFLRLLLQPDEVLIAGE
jgi:hypothetical protein